MLSAPDHKFRSGPQQVLIGTAAPAAIKISLGAPAIKALSNDAQDQKQLKPLFFLLFQAAVSLIAGNALDLIAAVDKDHLGPVRLGLCRSQMGVGH